MKILSLGLIFLALAVPCSAQAQTQKIDDPTLKKTVNLVNVFFTVKDSTGALAFNLTKESFEVREDGRPQTIQNFAAQSDQALTLGVLVDTSGSMQGMLPAEKFAAADFLRRALTARDLAFLISFDVNVDLAQDLTGDLSLLRSALDKTHINVGSAQSMRGRTLLYDAVYLAATEVFNKEVGRKAMVIFTSGEDYGSRVKIKEALEAAQHADVTCYVLLLGHSRFLASIGDVADATGGHMISVRSSDKLTEALAEITQELHNQYSLSYISDNQNYDGSFRKIEITSRQGHKIHARKGYYATPR